MQLLAHAGLGDCLVEVLLKVVKQELLSSCEVLYLGLSVDIEYTAEAFYVMLAVETVHSISSLPECGVNMGTTFFISGCLPQAGCCAF